MTHASLFSGIGGFDLAAEWCGWDNVFQVEIEEFPTKVLERHWPNVKRFRDIKKFDAREYRGTIDVLSGGFPCQPFSVAGKRRGKEDDRYLWPEMVRVIQEVRPRWVVGENVAGFIEMGLEQSCLDLEAEGYEVWPLVIPACAVEAPHRRDRVWIIGYSDFGGCNWDTWRRSGGKPENGHLEYESNAKHIADNSAIDRLFDSYSERVLSQRCYDGSRQAQLGRNNWTEDWFEVATRLCRMDDGVSDRVHRIKALGNAIVPQVAYEIFKAIDEVDKVLQGGVK